jgi:putative transcriptional regulator
MAKKTNEVVEALLESSSDLHRLGVMDDAAYNKIAARLSGPKPISGAAIRSLREKAKLSQSAFARALNLTPGYISQLERGVKEPKGPALALFNILRNKGVEVIL